MRGALATFAALVLMLGAASTAEARSPPVAFSDCLPPSSVRPMEILLACGDGTESSPVSRWTRWTRLSAPGCSS
jgi:hypothetical protein